MHFLQNYLLWALTPAILIAGWHLLGIMFIHERETGIVVKRWSWRNLPAGQIIALNGEAGIQADTLPPGLHFFYRIWQYTVTRTALVEVPQDHIALIVAHAGEPIPPGRILGRQVGCDHFQDARAFLNGGGERGGRTPSSPPGPTGSTPLCSMSSRLGTPPLTGSIPVSLRLHKVEPDRVGIVTTLDGTPITDGDIAGPLVPGHDNFQSAQAFLDQGGRRGLQEQIVLSGQWNINPWFAQVEQVPMVEIPIGHVGVVISYVGKAHEDVSGADFKHGDLVLTGHKGVWVSPLLPGKHPINTRVTRVELVPTHEHRFELGHAHRGARLRCQTQ